MLLLQRLALLKPVCVCLWCVCVFVIRFIFVSAYAKIHLSLELQNFTIKCRKMKAMEYACFYNVVSVVL